MPNFPTNFPNGPFVNPSSGRLSPGQNGTFFLLQLWNRTGGASGDGTAAIRTAARGLTPEALRAARTPRVAREPRRPAQGLTIGTVSPAVRARGT